MSRRTPAHTAMGASLDVDEQFASLGYLHFLASFCPRHQKLPALWLAKLFIPAVNNDCVRFFRNEESHVCAALIWARLDGLAVEQMLKYNQLPDQNAWSRGGSLWFLDVLAPFNHGKVVARHIARNPPAEPFYFARLNHTGAVRKVVRADARARGVDRMKTYIVRGSDGRVL